MAVGVVYIPITDWIMAGVGGGVISGGVPGLSGLKPEQRILLLSDGSLTLELELLSGPHARVEVRVELKAASGLSKDAARYLEETPGKPAMHREVWLTSKGRLLVYAQTLIPIDRIEKGLLNILEMDSSEPLGRVLGGRKIAVCKDRLEVAVLKCPKVAADLGLKADTPLMARRYILFNRDSSGGWIIKAGITEIFSPDVIPAPWPE